MPASKSQTGKARGLKIPPLAIVGLVVVAVGVALLIFGSSSGGTKLATDAPENIQTHESPQIADCISRCKDMLNVGADLSSGLCIVADLNGYGCAVASKGKSPCNTAGSSPQILLDNSCKLIKVVE